MVVCYEPGYVPMVEDPRNPGKFKPDVTWLITGDGKPVDNRFSEKQMRLLAESLHTSWKDDDGRSRLFTVMSNVGLFFSPTEPPLVPDVLLTVGISYIGNIHLKQYGSYFVWEYGKVPDVVVEIVSNKEGGEDTRKLDIYARIGVRRYVIFDPEQFLSGESIRFFELEDGEYQQVHEQFFPEVGLGLTFWDGAYEEWSNGWLRWCFEDSSLLPTGKERAEEQELRAIKEKRRADQEQLKAEEANRSADFEKRNAGEAKRLAEEEKLRADRLEAKLRKLGIDPSSNGSAAH